MRFRSTLASLVPRINIDRMATEFSAMPHYPFSIGHVITTVQESACGVYAIWYRTLGHDECLYVGSSNDMRRRLLEHLSGANNRANRALAWRIGNGGSSVYFSVMPFGSALLLGDLETALIKRLQPECNITHNP